MPGMTPPTSQLDWLISTTAMIVLSWSRATRDLLKSFGWGIRALHQLDAATMVPSPRRLPHTISPVEGGGFEPSVPRQKVRSRCWHPDDHRRNAPPKVRFARDSPLEEAVMSEPVSESPYSLVTGKNTGKPVGPTIRAFLIFGDISGLPVKFPDKETGNLA